MTEHDACLILNMISGIGYARYSALVRAFGSASDALAATSGELAQVKGIGETLARAVADWRLTVDLASELELAHRSGVVLYTLADPDYPKELRELPDPPLALYCRGRLPDFGCNTVAVVGSRRMSSYGRRMTEKITGEAVLAGWTVVSGLAFGVDAVAHTVTLAQHGTTVAVLGGGLLRIHPQEHVPLAARIVESGGAVLSEYPMGFPVSRQSFPRRNRIVAGLALATVVIEAGLDSGALITAKLALEQGKSVFALPGRVDEPQAAGCNRLIRDAAAKLIESFQDVLDDFAFLPGFRPDATIPAEAAATESATVATPRFFNDLEQRIYEALDQNGPGSLEMLAAATGAETGLLTGTLLALEIRNLVAKSPDGAYALR